MEWYANNTTLPTTPGTTPSTQVYPDYIGYITSLVAVLMYGSNFVPVKKFETGDGMFFQWVLCSGIFIESVVVQLIQQSEFYPVVMFGGMVWATGNLCVVPIIKTIGMGLGMSIWGTCALLAGWASGRFGWFGNDADVIKHSGMNYAGVGLAFGSILLYLMVKNEVSANTDMEINVDDEERDPLMAGTPGRNRPSLNDSNPSYQNADDVLVFNKSNNSNDDDEGTQVTIENLSPKMKRLVGSLLSVGSGFCYGINFAPAVHVQDEDKIHHSQNGLDYVFAHCTGIYVTSSIYFFGYCMLKKNKPQIYPSVILPGILSGIMWAIATSCWYIANATLSESVTFPIISTAPAAIASLFWGVCVFREIKGARNIGILLAAFCVMSAGAVLAGLSK